MQHLSGRAAGATYGARLRSPGYHPARRGRGCPYQGRSAAAAAAAAGGRRKAGERRGHRREGTPVASGEDASRSGDSGSDESSDTRDDDTDHKDSSAPKKRKSGNTSAEGEPSQAAVMRFPAVESPFPVKGRSASKLPVSAPGRAALPNATPNLNIGMDLWSASPALAVPAVQGEANPGLALARRDAPLDERELKRERRKQSNRESARRSRLRKQARKVAELTTENNALRAELDNLKKACQDMEAENSRLMGGMVHSQGLSVTTTLGMSIEAPKPQQHDNEGQLRKNTNNNSNGNYVGGSHKQEANTR
ncbi:hypothetical protein PR202_gb12656 [Eleusine coracana subsp. coracana]|uniref:BZIP domain-containing protein n=1 Tax=Eleusine coracana subsp. coracana TaxID=191504 RepID=A0AAV5ERN9_ELECO|nr:hypothetical protein PR202_gb12656 [Eleusine coracana subsp. coracana]